MLLCTAVFLSSDASSEYLSAVELTDTEDSGRHGTVLNQDPATQQVALMGGSYAGVSPMIIMNNFLLKQSQVVLLQPMVSNGSNSTQKAGCENGRQSRSYTPSKSYPRIAPHPGEHLSKRVGSSRLRGSSEHEMRQRKHHHSHRLYSATDPQATLQAPVRQSNTTVNNQVPISETQGCDTASTPLTGFSSMPTYTQEFQTALSDISLSTDKDTSANDGNKLKRFSNTYNILSKSGLLGITMRTKQLIKENRRTQGQLQQLQEQTSLLLEALSSGDTQLWTKLELSLQDTEKELRPAKVMKLTVRLHVF
uniref:Uncharacterized protein n=1 Tax=Periophthalmus magnuspinnatus TaxID=409849 RepID=A0A3B4ABZ4_9GOBI